MSEDDDILARLRAHVREERKDDSDFERVARGDADPRGDGSLEAARPLDVAAASRIAAKVAALNGTTSSARGARVVPLRRKLVAWGGPVALAAAVVLFVAARREGEDATAPELPTYGLTARGEQEMRGDPERGAKLRLGRAAASAYEIVMRPSAAVPDARIVAWAFAMEDRGPTQLDARIEISSDGAVRIRGDAKELRGAREIRVLIGTPESIGTYDEALSRITNLRNDVHARLLVVAIERAE